MKKIFLINLLIFSILSTNCFAIQDQEIENTMKEKIDVILGILKKNDTTYNQKGEKIIKIIGDMFDYELMAKISLGKDVWSSLTQQKQEEFIKVFEKKIKESYVDKIRFYGKQDVKIVSLKPYNKTRLQLKTLLIGNGSNYEVNYNFYNKEPNGNNWMIYDVDLVGVSVIQTYRQQFAGILKTKTFDEMFQDFKNK